MNDLNHAPYPWGTVALYAAWAIIAGWAAYGVAIVMGVAR